MNRRVSLGGLVALSLLTAACTVVGPDHQRPDTPLPAQFEGDAHAGSARVPADWWRAFGDPQLDALVADAMERSPDARQLLAQIDEAEAALREALAVFSPQIDLGAQGSRSRITTLGAQPVFAGIPVVRTDLRLAASTAFELDFWGRLRRGVEAVEAQTAASYLSADITRLTLASATVQAYLLLRSIDAQLAATRTALSLRSESLALIRRRAAGGLVSDLDVAQAEGARADSEAQLIELERQRSLVERQLGGLTGRPGLTVVPGDLKALPLPPVPPVGLPSALLDRRPDLRLAEQNLVAANARIGVARAAMLPTISLTGSLGGQSRDLSDLLASGARIWSLGFGLTLPIFDAGRLAARAEQAEARHRQLLAAYQKAAEAAFREVADALSGIERSARAEGVIEQRLAAARTAHGLAMRRYEAGYSSYLEVLDADRVRNDAEIALVRNRQARLSFSVDLMKALGGGWMEPIAARSAPAAAR